MMFFRSNIKTDTKLLRGFTLVELLITIAIVVLATGAVLARNSGFTQTTLLKSQTLEVSLDIRTAQQYGINVRAETASTRGAYGVYFDPAGSPGEYVLFLDRDDDLLYDSGEELGERYVLDPRFIIYQVCVPNGAGVAQCSVNRKGSVAFKRPNFDTAIGSTNTAGASGSYGTHGQNWIQIMVAAADDVTANRTVTVYESGQITVGN